MRNKKAQNSSLEKAVQKMDCFLDKIEDQYISFENIIEQKI